MVATRRSAGRKRQYLSKCEPTRKFVCVPVYASERALMKIKTDGFAPGTSDSEDMKWLVRRRIEPSINCLD